MRIKVFAMVCGLAVGVGVVSTAAAEPVLRESIHSKELLAGEANELLETIGRRAAEEELVLQINAPDIWESEILTPVRRGAGDTRLEVKFVNTLRDTVVIRGVKAGEDEDPLDTLKRITNNAKAHSIQDAAPEPARQQSMPPATKPNGPPTSPPDIERPTTEVPEMHVERPSAQLPETDTQASSRRAREKRVESLPAPEPEPVEQPAPEPPPVPAATEPDESGAAAREEDRFEDLYNDGRPIRRSLAPDELKPEDLVFSGEHRNVVVRRGISTDAFWLEGALPEERLEHQERNRYVVVEPAQASKPAPGPDEPLPGGENERERFERLYNEGDDIEATITIDELRPDDELFVGKTVTVVLRRSRVNVNAFWLAEPMKLKQPGVEHDEKNHYIIVGDVR